MTAGAESAKVIERQVTRHIASCPFSGLRGDCAFSERKSPTLHSSAASAQAESLRHLRDAHRSALALGVTATRRRQVVEETIELA